jgi:hypothetical protein
VHRAAGWLSATRFVLLDFGWRVFTTSAAHDRAAGSREKTEH